MSKRDFDHNFKKNVRLDMDQDPPNAARFEEIRANIHKRIAEEGLNGRAEEPPKKNKFPVGKTVGIIAACVVGFFVLVLALPDMPMAQALRSNTQKTLNQLFRPDETDEQGNIIRHFSDYDIMDEEIGFHLPRPGWIPDEYRLEDIRVNLCKHE